MNRLIDTQNRILDKVDEQHKRYLHQQINWENRLIGITGQRGVGKTTLLLQRLKALANKSEGLYFSADSLFIYQLGLFEVALQHYENGGKYLFIDEIHKYENWSGEIKHIYDSIPDLNVVFTGSSILDIYKGYGDLSRRAIQYTLHGLSFREYLEFETKKEYQKAALKDILAGKVNFEVEKPLFHFKNYLQKGYYPFYQQADFESRIVNVITTILEVDLIHYLNLNASTIGKLKKLLQIIAQSVPFKPNISKLAEKTSISRNLLLDYLQYLQRAGLIILISSSAKGIQNLAKPEKIYLNNPNLSYALSGAAKVDIGNLRETFFASQLLMSHPLTIPLKGDFLVEETVFEVGGKNKTMTQIKDIKNAYLAKDDLISAYQNQIPLWHFGFLY